MSRPLLGVVADDVTGATDIAGMIAAEGLATTLVLGEPDDTTPPPGDAECVVVALVTRTAPRARAVGESVRSARWLLEQGATTVYQKYCSTFDSTAEGMIGPIAEGLIDLLGTAGNPPVVSIGTPAGPRLGRTVYNGHLFVGTALLSESSMRDHPLTPMRDSNLVTVLGAQTSLPVGLVPWKTVRQGADAVRGAIDALVADGARHVLLDALTDDDLDTAAVALPGGTVLLAGGGSGLGAALARRRYRAAGAAQAPASVADGEKLIVAGSCSSATRSQIAAFTGPTFYLDAIALAADERGTVDRLVDGLAAHYRAHPGEPVLAYSSADPAEIERIQHRLGRDRVATLVESALGLVARRAVTELGVRSLMVAGGETSGAVTSALGIRSLTIGRSVDPGVVWTTTGGDRPIALLLKSGNFGRTRLFTEGWAG